MDLILRTATPTQRPVEVVERKGIGHPDTICDGIAEQISRSLCQFYQARCGHILHHNVDKVLLVGGGSRVQFGGGEILEPIEIYLAGRATNEVDGTRFPVDELAVEACRDWLRDHLRYIDLERHVRIFPRIRAGSADLTSLFERGRGRPLANDTSCGVGFAPLSELERLVLAVERSLNSAAIKRVQPAIGEDIKVMGVRTHDQITLTIGCAFVARHVGGPDAYRAAKSAAREVALAAARDAACSLPVDALVNAADNIDRGEVFLTAIGTSAESGDDGEVGRGNRANGLITPYRPMTMEAAAGKNPVSHVGKVYNAAAGRLATTLASELPSVRGVTCLLLSQIGRAVDDPHVVDIELELDDYTRVQDLRADVESIVRDQLGQLPELCQLLVSGQLSVY